MDGNTYSVLEAIWQLCLGQNPEYIFAIGETQVSLYSLLEEDQAREWRETEVSNLRKSSMLSDHSKS